MNRYDDLNERDIEAIAASDPDPADIPLEVDYFLDLETDFGCQVRDLRMKNNHYLLWKIPMEAMSDGSHGDQIHLPDIHRRRKIGNLVTILGFVILKTGTYFPKFTKHDIERENQEMQIAVWEAEVAEKRGEKAQQYTPRPHFKVKMGNNRVPGDIEPGDAVVYNSYNIGQIEACGLREPLCIVRGIDVESVFPAEGASQVELGDFAMTRACHGR